MRPVSLLLVFAACSGTGDGAVLSFTAPDGPGTASRIELVLASAAPEAQTATRQRVRPGMPHEEDVVYYRQRSTVDAIVDISSVDGFEVRIEPDVALVPDEAFIPFALIYDEADALIAVGTVNDDAGAPTSVRIKAGLVASYDVAVLALAPDLDTAGVGPGQGHAVVCASEAGPWHSGAVWKRADGPQIRLLLPDLAEDPAATDAMLRGSDLDCDQYPADDRDCDDLRVAYHAGQTETCDGQDTDCDGRRLELIQGCPVTTNLTCSATGVSLCAEGPNDAAATGTCVQTAACACSSTGGSPPPGCQECILDWSTAPGGVTPCAPAVGKLHTDQCAAPGCTIDVVSVTGPWEIKIAATPTGPFSVRLTGITTGDYWLRARYLGMPLPDVNATSLGAAYIGVTSPLQLRPSIVAIDLGLENQPQQCAPDSMGDNAMRCTQ